MSNTEDISIPSLISTKEEAQLYLETEARRMLPEAVSKLRTALATASKPKDIVDIVDKIRSYAQVRQTSDNTGIAAAGALGMAINPEGFAKAFSVMGKAFGIEVEEGELIDSQDIETQIEIIEELEKSEIEDIEEIDEMETIEEEEKEDPPDEEINDFQFG